MGVVGFAQEAPDSPEASFELGKHVITRKFKVQCSDKNDGPITVLGAVGLPRLFQIYQFGNEEHIYCRCRSIDPVRLKPGSPWWLVTCRYETPDIKSESSGEGGGGGGGGGSDGGGTGSEVDGQYDNPQIELPEVQTHFETEKVPITGVQGLGVTADVVNGSPNLTTKNTSFFAVGDNVVVYKGSKYITSSITAISGMTVTLANAWTGATGTATFIDINLKPCMGSTGEIFVPPPMRDRSRLVLTITRNEDINAPHPLLSVIYQDAVNSDVFWGSNPGTVKCQSITCQRQQKPYTGGLAVFLKVTYVFHFQDSWDLQLLDVGTWHWYQKTLADPRVKKKFTTDDQHPRQGLLDGNGNELPDGQAPVFLTVRPYNYLPFSALNLPQSFQAVQ